MSVELLNLEFLSFKGGCTCSSESTLIIKPHCWKSHVAAYYYLDAPLPVFTLKMDHLLRNTEKPYQMDHRCKKQLDPIMYFK